MPEKNKSITGSARKILRFLSRVKLDSPLLILTHDYPDPDTLASAYALSYLCGYFKIQTKIKIFIKKITASLSATLLYYFLKFWDLLHNPFTLLI